MAGKRIPIEVVQARGAKHLTKEEIKERKSREVKPIDDNIIAPAYLTKKQKDEFYKIAGQLQRLKIIGETDADALGRYIIANEMYATAVKKLRSKEVKNEPLLFDRWTQIQERYFKQCRAGANDLGLTISSRCRLVVPEPQSAGNVRENKFKKFEKVRASSE